MTLTAKIRHIFKEYKKVTSLCEMSGGKAMKFRKYFVYKWREMKDL